MSHVISIMTFLPLVGMLLVCCIPNAQERLIKQVALVTCVLTLLVSGVAYYQFSLLPAEQQRIDYQPAAVEGAAITGFQPPLGEKVPWITQLNINYEVGVDGLSLPLILLTTVLMVLVVIYSWDVIKDRPKWYYAFFLLLETAMLGVFVSLDVFLFYVFFEIGLVPMYFLIGIWGGPRREYAAIKFFLYTLVGSLAMLLALLALYIYSGQVGPATFSILQLAAVQPLQQLQLSPTVGALIFWGIFLGFAIKVPMWPFHTWLPDAHVEAPTAGSVILAGVLLKLGTYGFLRILLPCLPAQCEIYGSFIVILAAIAVVYGALVAMAQKDLKKLVAYSSVNHMGYVMLGIGTAMMYASQLGANTELGQKATMAVNGAVLQMICHGVITAGLFFLVGIVYERTHTRMIGDYGGIMKLVPQYSGVLMVMCFASLGLPGLAGFVAEFHVFVGAIGTALQAGRLGLADSNLLLWASCFSILGVLVTAAYFLWMLQRLILGPVNESLVERAHGHLTDLDRRELVTMTPLVVLTLLIGIIPGPVVLNLVNDYVWYTLTTLKF
ncbi:MAG: NADH-quinone oxidoreductase subunit M [Fimbriimonadaceae bacterium]|nr:NADH-quinone oxidoreductase subunit M [Fimbriimonadaceae bacterium]